LNDQKNIPATEEDLPLDHEAIPYVNDVDPEDDDVEFSRDQSPEVDTDYEEVNE